MTIHLDARLSLAASFVRSGSVVADIGTDHAYLPVHLVETGVCPRAFACDKRTDPLQNAKQTVEAAGLSDRITTLLSDGLDALPPGCADDVVFAGMGGILIAELLNRAAWLKNESVRVIVQPMSHAEDVRLWLFENGFAIDEEAALFDRHHGYVVLAAHYTGENAAYTSAMLYGGTLFGKDVWDPQGFLFILQQGKFRFFGAKGKEPGEAWNLIAKDETEERDYRFTLGADNMARLFGADGRELCALATDRSTASHHTLWLFACDCPHAVFGQFRLYAMKIGTDAGETLRDFVPARRMNDKAVGLYDRVTKRFFANAGKGAFLAPGDQPPRGRRWSLARAREWGRTNPWYCGFNHVPANAINDVEIWAKETFSPDLIRSEFKLATDLGFNCVRIFLQYKVYEADPAWFLKAYAIALMRKCFRWAREVGPSQPLTVASYRGNDHAFDAIVLAESDIITFHFYGNAAGTRKKIAEMSVAGRPIICTEWLFRPSGCDVPNILCIYKETGIGCMLWGLVNGKAQTHLPNGEFTPNFKGSWKHDLFHSDHRPYSVKDLELIREATRSAGGPVSSVLPDVKN